MFTLAVLLLLLAGVGYLGYENYLLKETKAELESRLVSLNRALNDTQGALASTTKNLKGEINDLENKRDTLEQDLEAEKNKLNFLSLQISTIESAVNVIEKLNQLDPEILKKYSKVSFLNENYTPKNLLPIDPKFSFESEKEQKMLAEVLPFLIDLLNDAESANTKLKLISSYRSFGEQAGIKSFYQVVFGSGANQFSADQGYSEHQIGTTIDFTTENIGSDYSTFDKTTAFEWLFDNAYQYGFVLSYPKNNFYYQYEPWHWRFVGRNLATRLQLDKQYFYDLDQRLIDQHLLFVFD